MRKQFIELIFAVLVALLLGLRGVYLLLGTFLIFGAGIISSNLWSKKRKRDRVFIIKAIALLLVIALIYAILPFRYALEAKNIKDTPVIAGVKILDSGGTVIFEDKAIRIDTTLNKGTYTILVESPGYETANFSVINRFGFDNAIEEAVQLNPRLIRFSSFDYLDPTLTVLLEPSFSVKGKNILGEIVTGRFGYDSSIMYGDYLIDIAAEGFGRELGFSGDSFILDDKKIAQVRLMPGEGFITLNEEEKEHILKFMKDYISLSKRGLFDKADEGFPKQFYLYGKDEVVSLGGMIFFLCELNSYNVSGAEATYFIPKASVFEKGPDSGSCYEAALAGIIPGHVNNASIEDWIFSELGEGKSADTINFNSLNTKIRSVPVAFSFDIESGRYVAEASSVAVSPCDNANYSLGLQIHEIVCDNPAFVAWMSPVTGKDYSEYPYPQVSGILGYKEILSYAENYGIPVTNYYVKKEVIAFEELEPELINRTRALIDKGLIEVGSHTRYHTNLGLVDEAVARQEMLQSRLFLQKYFGVPVYGFRAPYLSTLRDEKTYADALAQAGYAYSSELGAFERAEGFQVFKKPWNAGAYTAYQSPEEFERVMAEKSHVITLDHPWNMVYQEGVILTADENIKENYRAVILSAIANGGIPVTVKDLVIGKVG